MGATIIMDVFHDAWIMVNGPDEEGESSRDMTGVKFGGGYDPVKSGCPVIFRVSDDDHNPYLVGIADSDDDAEEVYDWAARDSGATEVHLWIDGKWESFIG